MADEQPTVEQTTETQETKEEQTNQEVTKAPETKFTEEDVNNIVKQRLAKERASIYKKLDVEDLDTAVHAVKVCLLYTSPSPRDGLLSRMPSSA